MPSGVCYIGSTINLRSRCRDHYYRLKSGTHRARRLQDAWDASSPSEFVFLVLEICAREKLQEREQSWVDAAPVLFNTTRYVQCPSQDPIVAAKIGAASRSIGPEARAVQSRIRTEAWKNGEYRARMLASTSTAHRNPITSALHSEVNRRTWRDPDVRSRRSAGISKATSTPEMRRARSDAAKAQWADPAQRAIKIAAIRAKAHVMSAASKRSWASGVYRGRHAAI